jgi:hypothetical protein
VADLRRARLDDGRGDRQRLGDRIDIEFEIERQRLRGAKRDLLRFCGSEA